MAMHKIQSNQKASKETYTQGKQNTIEQMVNLKESKHLSSLLDDLAQNHQDLNKFHRINFSSVSSAYRDGRGIQVTKGFGLKIGEVNRLVSVFAPQIG